MGKVYRHREGECPKCKSDNIEYGSSEMHDSQISYDFICQVCGFMGKEWFRLVYIETREVTNG